MRTQPTHGSALVASLGKFLAVGLTGVVVNSAALLLLRDGARLPLLLASALATELAIANNFVWNDRWTFAGSGERSLTRFLRFNLVSLAGLAIATATLWVLVTALDVQLLAANLLGIAAATTWNFLSSRAWAWRRTR